MIISSPATNPLHPGVHTVAIVLSVVLLSGNSGVSFIIRPTILTLITENCSLQFIKTVSLQFSEKKNGLTSSQTGLYFIVFLPLSLPPPVHLPIPVPNQAFRGFSTATAFLLCSSFHPALPQSISLLCHSWPTVALHCLYLLSFAPHPPLQ